jgi:hypothetical protein
MMDRLGQGRKRSEGEGDGDERRGEGGKRKLETRLKVELGLPPMLYYDTITNR